MNIHDDDSSTKAHDTRAKFSNSPSRLKSRVKLLSAAGSKKAFVHLTAQNDIAAD